MPAAILDRFFRFRDAGSTPGREALGGLTTFLTMAYIVFVNPSILSSTGMSAEGVFAATCLAAALGTLLMALLANYPIALAPGMGMNAFFAFTLCGNPVDPVPWPTALGLVFWSGLLFLVLTVTGVRKAIVQAIPPVLKLSAAAGIGLFIAFIGLKQGGVVRDHPATLVSMGDLASGPAILAIAGLGATLALAAAKVRTAIFWGMLFTAGLGLVSGALAAPASVVALPSFDLPGFQIDLWGALQLKYVPLLLVLLFFDIFDTLGTLMGIAHEGGFLRDGRLPRLERALAADGVATFAGALFGTSTVTSYIESGTGVGVGARTGLAGVVTGLLFLAALFFAPLATVVGAGMIVDGIPYNPVTAPALIVVGTLMMRAVREIEWDKVVDAAPAFFTMLLMPLTFNISHGLAAGIMLYVLVRLASGKGKDVHWLMYVLAGAFLLRYAFLPTG